MIWWESATSCVFKLTINSLKLLFILIYYEIEKRLWDLGLNSIISNWEGWIKTSIVYLKKSTLFKWDKIFEYGLSKFCDGQPLKNFKGYCLRGWSRKLICAAVAVQIIFSQRNWGLGGVLSPPNGIWSYLRLRICLILMYLQEKNDLISFCVLFSIH